MSDTLRAFIAFELPESVASTIGGVQKDIKSSGVKIRWVKPGNIHLTLKFLGDIKSEDLEKVETAIKESARGVSKINLLAKGMGLFPGIKKPRVMWLGVGGQLESLFKLQSTLDENLEKSGFPRDKRPFKGHLTLGRIKGKIDTKKLVDSMRSLKGVESDSFFADRIILFKSDLKPTGAVYTKLSSTALED